ncbi:MAG: nucleotidyltransferase domain-containing protein [Bacteroidetes bacterium]|nr:nucleotidyltransferase domain-containing protein [Bacteroidota bacterium]
MVINRVLDEIFRTWSNVAVLRALLDTNTGFSGNEVARVAGMNPRSAFKALTSLEELGLAIRVVGGRDHIFTLNREHYLVQEIVLKIYPIESKFLDEVITALSAILKGHVYSAVIFGSVARKEEKSLSDLDICCVVNSPLELLFVRDLLNKKSSALYKKYGIRLAPVIFMKAQFMRKRKTKLIKDIAGEGILITGKSIKGLING